MADALPAPAPPLSGPCRQGAVRAAREALAGARALRGLRILPRHSRASRGRWRRASAASRSEARPACRQMLGTMRQGDDVQLYFLDYRLRTRW